MFAHNVCWLGRALCVAVMVMVTLGGGIAQAGLVLDWQYFESEAQLGQSEVVVLSDKQETIWGSEPSASAMAEVDGSLGGYDSSVAGLAEC